MIGLQRSWKKLVTHRKWQGGQKFSWYWDVSWIIVPGMIAVMLIVAIILDVYDKG